MQTMYIPARKWRHDCRLTNHDPRATKYINNRWGLCEDRQRFWSVIRIAVQRENGRRNVDWCRAEGDIVSDLDENRRDWWFEMPLTAWVPASQIRSLSIIKLETCAQWCIYCNLSLSRLTTWIAFLSYDTKTNSKEIAGPTPCPSARFCLNSFAYHDDRSPTQGRLESRRRSEDYSVGGYSSRGQRKLAEADRAWDAGLTE